MAAAKRRARKAKIVATVVDDATGLGGGIAQKALRAAHNALTRAREIVRSADAQLPGRMKPKKKAAKRKAAAKRPKARRAKRKA
jgi:hypothetical protein